MTPSRHQVVRNPAVQRAPDWSSPMRILRELGYVENQNFDIVYRSSGGNRDRLPTLAEELAQLKPDVILAIAIAAAVLALQLPFFEMGALSDRLVNSAPV